jgi:hypothetical protein
MQGSSPELLNGGIDGSELDTELDKRNRFGAVPIYPKQYESDREILENESDYGTDLQNRRTFDEISNEDSTHEKLVKLVKNFRPDKI